MFDKLLLTLFSKYAELLKKRFSDDFREIVSTDDYMPMPIQNDEEYDKVLKMSWYDPEKPREEQSYVASMLLSSLLLSNPLQLPLRSAVFPNVSSMLS